MSKKIFFITFVSLFCFIGLATAEVPISFPQGCLNKGYGLHKKHVRLNPEKTNEPAGPRVYLFYNRSNERILLNHPVHDPGASAGWSSVIAPQHWSAMMLKQKKFDISCRQFEQKYQTVVVSCAHVLQVCYFPKIAAKNKNMLSGDYWIAENLATSRQLIYKIYQRSILLNRVGS